MTTKKRARMPSGFNNSQIAAAADVSASLKGLGIREADTIWKVECETRQIGA
jgi:hypothetical protein